jgi:hypothetical protein
MTIAERFEVLHRVATAEAGRECQPRSSTDSCDRLTASRPPVEMEAPLIAEPLEPVDSREIKTGLLDLIELILKRRTRLEQIVRDRSLQSMVLPKLLAISILGFVLFGVSLALVFTASGEWPRLVPATDILAGRDSSIGAFDWKPGSAAAERWSDGSAFALIGAYAIGLIAATGVCLPSLYFYSLLAGVRMTMLDIVCQALKSKANTAVALVGVLPIYAALGLATVIFDMPDPVRHATFWLGLCLPFLAGLFGTYSLYLGLAGFADTLPPARRTRRECFLQRLVISWAACYTAVSPVMIHTLWVTFANL